MTLPTKETINHLQSILDQAEPGVDNQTKFTRQQLLGQNNDLNKFITTLGTDPNLGKMQASKDTQDNNIQHKIPSKFSLKCFDLQTFFTNLFLLIAGLNFVKYTFQEEHFWEVLIYPSAAVCLELFFGLFSRPQQIQAMIKHDQALQNKQKVSIMSSGKLIQVPKCNLMIGDLIKLEPYQQVPADILLLKSYTGAVVVNESFLTQKESSQEIPKYALADSQTQNKFNPILFSGARIKNHRLDALGIVIGIGKDSFHQKQLNRVEPNGYYYREQYEKLFKNKEFLPHQFNSIGWKIFVLLIKGLQFSATQNSWEEFFNFNIEKFIFENLIKIFAILDIMNYIQNRLYLSYAIDFKNQPTKNTATETKFAIKDYVQYINLAKTDTICFDQEKVLVQDTKSVTFIWNHVGVEIKKGPPYIEYKPGQEYFFTSGINWEENKVFGTPQNRQLMINSIFGTMDYTRLYSEESQTLLKFVQQMDKKFPIKAQIELCQKIEYLMNEKVSGRAINLKQKEGNQDNLSGEFIFIKSTSQDFIEMQCSTIYSFSENKCIPLTDILKNKLKQSFNHMNSTQDTAHALCLAFKRAPSSTKDCLSQGDYTLLNMLQVNYDYKVYHHGASEELKKHKIKPILLTTCEKIDQVKSNINKSGIISTVLDNSILTTGDKINEIAQSKEQLSKIEVVSRCSPSLKAKFIEILQTKEKRKVAYIGIGPYDMNSCKKANTTLTYPNSHDTVSGLSGVHLESSTFYCVLNAIKSSRNFATEKDNCGFLMLRLFFPLLLGCFENQELTLLLLLIPIIAHSCYFSGIRGVLKPSPSKNQILKVFNNNSSPYGRLFRQSLYFILAITLQIQYLKVIMNKPGYRSYYGIKFENMGVFTDPQDNNPQVMRILETRLYGFMIIFICFCERIMSKIRSQAYNYGILQLVISAFGWGLVLIRSIDSGILGGLYDELIVVGSLSLLVIPVELLLRLILL